MTVIRVIMTRVARLWRSGRNGKIAVGCGSLLGVCLLCSMVNAVLPKSATVTPTPAAAAAVVTTPTPIPVRDTATPAPPTATPGPTNTPGPTSTPKPTATAVPPTNTPSPAAQVEAAARNYFKDRFRRAMLTNLGDYNVAAIEATALAINDSTAVSQSTRDFVQLVPLVMALPEVGVLQVRYYTDRVQGLAPNDVALAFTISRETADKVDWKQVDSRRLTTLLTTTEKDGLKVAPALKQAWDSYEVAVEAPAANAPAQAQTQPPTQEQPAQRQQQQPAAPGERPTAAPAPVQQAAGGAGSFPPNGSVCPENAPIKGNRSSSGEWIYHRPGQQAYTRTIPEECFATEDAARAAGYRPAQR